MADVLHQVFGACSVLWGTSGSETLIGFSRDGVSIRIEPRWGDIQSDDYGGDGGVPSDSQFLGATATITAELTKYDDVTTAGALITSKLGSFVKSGATGLTAGTLGSTAAGIGTLVRGTDIEGTLILTTGTLPSPASGDRQMTFETAFLRGAQEVNKGTKYSTYIVSWEAWANSATGQVLYADVTTA